jgi:hypothetical protein
MSSSFSRVGAGEFESDRGVGVREAVLAGPGMAVGLDERARSWLLDRLVGCDAVAQALASCGHVDVRRRALPGDVTVKVVLGLGLFSAEGYDSVLAKVYPAVSGPLPRRAVPSGSALSQARVRVHEKVFRALFQASATGPQPVPATGGSEFGLELTAFDGTTFDLADTQEMAACFATPTGGRHPQARVVTLTACGTRKIRAAAVGSYATSEQELVDTLVDQLAAGTLNLADRNFFSMARFLAAAATGAQLAWRVKNSNAHLPAKVSATLPDGSQLVRLHESDGMLSRRRRNTGDYTLPRLADTTARLVEFRPTRPHPTQPVSDPDHPARPPRLPSQPHRRRIRPTLASRSCLLPDQGHSARQRRRPTWTDTEPRQAGDLGHALPLQHPVRPGHRNRRVPRPGPAPDLLRRRRSPHPRARHRHLYLRAATPGRSNTPRGNRRPPHEPLRPPTNQPAHQ